MARDSREGLSGDSQGQVLAANVDVAFVTEPSMSSTDVADLGRIERLVALAWESGAQPVVLLTKADLFGRDIEELVADVAAAAPGVDVHAVAVPPEPGATSPSQVATDGIATVRSYLSGARTGVLLVGPRAPGSPRWSEPSGRRGRHGHGAGARRGRAGPAHDRAS